MEGGGRQSVSIKYTNSKQRHGARAQGLGKMVTNTEVSAQGKAEDGKDLDTRDPGMGGEQDTWTPGRNQLGDFLLGPHHRRTLDGGEHWNWIYLFLPRSRLLHSPGS